MSSLFFLIDCNNFYVSCERVFNPALMGKPVAVLSSNDGCIVARSEEVKALGIPMGAPAFKYRAQIKRYGIQVFSSNYSLYGDMSRRVMEVLSHFTPDMEIYSIDEAFLSFPGGIPGEPESLAKKIKETVERWTGIPISIGIASTKTLAKIANRIAKISPEYGGVFNLTDPLLLEDRLEKIRVGEVWGVGKRHEKTLRSRGIYTARQLRNAPDAWVRHHLTVMGLRIVWELRGIPCIPLEEAPPPKKGILSSRTFGKWVETREELGEAVALYTSRAAEKLRKHYLLASCVQVFLTTSPYREGPQYANAVTISLENPTSYTPDLVRVAREGIGKIFKPGYQYKKAGVMLLGLTGEGAWQPNLFFPSKGAAKKRRLMHAMDLINHRYGSETLRLAASGFERRWRVNSSQRSPRYTTCWEELPIVV